ncbi:MAG: class I SAM-dependent methyltransferase [Nanoarchaeota archaeon]|nr:class I SAM-dependent methyltransferase [Nanoarchaeota archaeon]
MDIIELNEQGWNQIGEKAALPYLNQGNYSIVFNEFCRAIPKKGAILDLGCGPGIPVTKELLDRGFKVTAIDFSEEMIKAAKKNIPQATLRKISMTEIDYANEFDGVIASYTMLCLDPDNFDMTAKKISIALKKCGFFFIALNEPKKMYNEEDYHTKIDGQTIYSRPYSEKEITDVFSKYSMKVIQVKREIYNSDMYGKEYCLIMLLRKD